MARAYEDVVGAAMHLRDLAFCVEVCDAVGVPAGQWPGPLREIMEVVVIMREARAIEREKFVTERHALRTACARYGVNLETMRSRIRRWQKEVGSFCTQNDADSDSAE